MTKKIIEDTPQTKILEISKDITKVELDAKKIIISDRKTYEEASVFLSSVIKPRVNRVNEWIKRFTDPYVEARRVALANKQQVEQDFEGAIKPLLEIEKSIKSSMTDFLRKEEAEAKKEEDRLAKLRDKQNERREEKGQAPIMTPVATIERPQTTIKSETGSTTAKKVWKFEITNYAEIPDYVKDIVLNLAKEEGLFNKAIKGMVAGGTRQINGVKIYEDFDISARTR